MNVTHMRIDGRIHFAQTRWPPTANTKSHARDSCAYLFHMPCGMTLEETESIQGRYHTWWPHTNGGYLFRAPTHTSYTLPHSTNITHNQRSKGLGLSHYQEQSSIITIACTLYTPSTAWTTRAKVMETPSHVELKECTILMTLYVLWFPHSLHMLRSYCNSNPHQVHAIYIYLHYQGLLHMLPHNNGHIHMCHNCKITTHIGPLGFATGSNFPSINHMHPSSLLHCSMPHLGPWKKHVSMHYSSPQESHATPSHTIVQLA